MATAKKALNKSQLAMMLAEETSLSKAQVNSVLAAIDKTVRQELGKKGPGVFTLHGLLKLTVVKKPATKAHMGKDPFTGEERMFAAKPARNIVRARVLKSLKDAV